jgi:hypothetical protein
LEKNKCENKLKIKTKELDTRDTRNTSINLKKRKIEDVEVFEEPDIKIVFIFIKYLLRK